MKPTFHDILSFNAGYADTVGFLALQGLFTARVTGNFVTLAAALVHGTTGAAAVAQNTGSASSFARPE